MTNSAKRLSFICPANYLAGSICLPCTLPAGRQAWASSPQNGTIRGISACKVYPQMMLPSKAVSSYLTFSPLCRLSTSARLFSVALSYQLFNWHHLLGGMSLFAVQTFLLNVCRFGDNLTCSFAKLRFFRFYCKRFNQGPE